MEFDLTDAEQALLAGAASFSAEIVAPAAAAWERERRLDRAALVDAAALGLTGLEVPAGQGGLGFSFSCKARLAEILAAADFGFAMSLVNTQNVAARLARDADPAVAARYVPDLLAASRLGCTALTEPHAGSDFAAIRTVAARDGDGWVLNGEKAWIINAAEADVIVVYAQTDPGSGGAGIGSFLVDGQRGGFVRRQPFALSGQNTIGAGGFGLVDYRVRPDEVLLPPGSGFKRALTDINGARTYVAAMCCGMVAAAARIAADYGQSRRTFGRRLVEHQGWRWALARADVELAAARLLVIEASGIVDAGWDARDAAARAKIFATDMAERHLPALTQLMGAEGLRDTYPFGRHTMGAKVAGYVDGSTEMLLERLTAGHVKAR